MKKLLLFCLNWIKITVLTGIKHWLNPLVLLIRRRWFDGHGTVTHLIESKRTQITYKNRAQHYLRLTPSTHFTTKRLMFEKDPLFRGLIAYHKFGRNFLKITKLFSYYLGLTNLTCSSPRGSFVRSVKEIVCWLPGSF